MIAAREGAKGRFLATLEIARCELVVLEYSHAKRFSATIDTDWVRSLTDDMAAAETLEAFVSRFGRFQDTVGDKLLPRALAVVLERPRSFIDNLSRAEQLGWIEEAKAWIAARALRNHSIHEHLTDPERFSANLRAAGGFMGTFRRSYANFRSLAEEHFGVSEAGLRAYHPLPFDGNR